MVKPHHVFFLVFFFFWGGGGGILGLNNLPCSVVAERSSALDSSSGVVRMWVRIPAWPVEMLVSLSKTLNHNCFVLRMGRKAVGPVCCAMHVKEPRTLIVKEKGLAPVFLDSCLEHPAEWICARYKSSVLLLLLLLLLCIFQHLLFFPVSLFSYPRSLDYEPLITNKGNEA